jgi:putative cell wall-binding protein
MRRRLWPALLVLSMVTAAVASAGVMPATGASVGGRPVDRQPLAATSGGPLVTISAFGGSVMADPDTGLLVIAVPWFDRSSPRVDARPRCEPDATPSAARLLFGTESLILSPQNDGTFYQTVWYQRLADNTAVSLQYDCDEGTVTTPVGSVDRYHPSGFVTDILTGAPVVGASLALYQVPGWRARSAGEPDTTPSTCESAASKRSPDTPWTQPAPTGLGVPVDPATVRPAVRTFVTDHRGYYGWDVPAGCYYVEVAHGTYHPLTSPVVGVPQGGPLQLSELDLQLTPVETTWYPAGGLTRLAGANRVETAVEVSRATFPLRAPISVLATQHGFADALAGGPLGALGGGPILLTDRDWVPNATMAELRRLRTLVMMLGGTDVITIDEYPLGRHLDVWIGGLPAFRGSVTRVAGPDRFATAAEVSRLTFPVSGIGVAHVANGATFPDALTGGAAAARRSGPVLLVRRDAVPGVTAEELARLAPRRIVVLGGTAAVSDTVLAALRNLTSGPVTRVAGPDRFATAAAVAATFPAPAPSVFVATGSNYPDALAAVPAAGRQRAPVLLITRTGIPEPVRAELARLRPYRIFVLGGEAVIAPEVLDDLARYLR